MGVGDGVRVGLGVDVGDGVCVGLGVGVGGFWKTLSGRNDFGLEVAVLVGALVTVGVALGINVLVIVALPCAPAGTAAATANAKQAKKMTGKTNSMERDTLSGGMEQVLLYMKYRDSLDQRQVTLVTSSA